MNQETAIACVARLLMPACNLCGGHDHRRVFCRQGDNLVRCAECNLMFVRNLPGKSAIVDRASAMARLGETMPPPGSRRSGRMERLAKRDLRVLLKLVKAGPGKKLLDIGCHGGFFLNRARAAGFDVQGTDYSPEATRFAQEHFHLDVYCGDWTQAEYANQSFDIVTLLDVLEYLPDPLAELAAIRRLLKYDGVLLLTVSNSAGIIHRLFRFFAPRRKAGVAQPLYRFSPDTLTEIVALAGYEPISIESGFGVGKRFALAARKGSESLAA